MDNADRWREWIEDAPRTWRIGKWPNGGEASGFVRGPDTGGQWVEVVEQSRLVEQLDQMWRDATAEPLTEERHGYKLAVFELKAWLASSAEPGERE